MNIRNASTEDLQRELLRREIQAKRALYARRRKVVALLDDAFRKIPELKEALIPEPNDVLLSAFKDPREFEITLQAVHHAEVAE
jgi:hypothetical protein